MAMSRGARRWVVGGAAVALLLVLSLPAMAFLYFVVPKMEARWADFGVDLGPGQRALIAASRIVIQRFYLILPAVVVALLGVLMSLGLRLLIDIPDREGRRPPPIPPSTTESPE